MKNKMLTIIENYGVGKQLKYFQSEIFELNEAIITHELKKSVEYEIPLTELLATKDHLTEEIADCLVMLGEFIAYYDLDKEEIKNIMNFKLNRQLERLKKENGQTKI